MLKLVGLCKQVEPQKQSEQRLDFLFTYKGDLVAYHKPFDRFIKLVPCEYVPDWVSEQSLECDIKQFILNAKFAMERDTSEFSMLLFSNKTTAKNQAKCYWMDICGSRSMAPISFEEQLLGEFIFYYRIDRQTNKDLNIIYDNLYPAYSTFARVMQNEELRESYLRTFELLHKEWFL